MLTTTDSVLARQPLLRVVFAQHMMLFVPFSANRLVELATVCSNFRETISDYGEAIFDCWRRNDPELFEEEFLGCCRDPIGLALNFLPQFVAAGADVDGYDAEGLTPLMLCIEGASWRDAGHQKDHHTTMQLLLQLGADVNVQSEDEDENTVLHRAAAVGDHVIDCVRTLISAGAVLDAQNDVDQTPLFKAAENGAPECVTALVKAGAELDVQDCIGWTALIAAARNEHDSGEECVRILVEAGADVNLSTESGETALIFATLYCYDVVHVLLEAGADVDEELTSAHDPHPAGATALWCAVSFDNRWGASLLLAYGAEKNIVVDGKWLQQLAAEKKNESILEYLLSDTRARLHALLYVTELGDCSCVFKTVLSRSSGGDAVSDLLNVRHQGWTLIMVAAQRGRADCLKELLLAAVATRDGVASFVNLINDEDDKCSALHYAVVHNHLECVKLLLANHAQVNATDSNCSTPLHHAAYSAYSGVMTELLRAGASTAMRDEAANTALDVAKASDDNIATLEERRKCIKLLEEKRSAGSRRPRKD